MGTAVRGVNLQWCHTHQADPKPGQGGCVDFHYTMLVIGSTTGALWDSVTPPAASPGRFVWLVVRLGGDRSEGWPPPRWCGRAAGGTPSPHGPVAVLQRHTELLGRVLLAWAQPGQR